jgi:hypothetical protein
LGVGRWVLGVGRLALGAFGRHTMRLVAATVPKAPLIWRKLKADPKLLARGHQKPQSTSCHYVRPFGVWRVSRTTQLDW